MSIPIITIIGRQNVGKSTLFNRIAGRRIAIVSDIPGTTRDRISINTHWSGNHFALVDTAGVGGNSHSEILKTEIDIQFTEAVNVADAIIMVVDVMEGVTSGDIDVINVIRKSGKPCVLAVNKVDSPAREIGLNEFYSMAIADPIPISAYHDIGITDLIEKIFGLIPKRDQEIDETNSIRIAIVGRPNVGKSALFNLITNSNRSIVSPMPGTTRDAIDSTFTFQNQSLTFIDTAGLRRRGKTQENLEKYSVIRTFNSIEKSHVAILVLDITEIATAQDTHIGGFINQASKAGVIILNKWDLSENMNINSELLISKVANIFKFIPGVPILLTSAETGFGVKKIIPSIIRVWKEYSKKVDGSDLSKTLFDAIGENPIPGSGYRRPIIFKISQTKTSPPTFSLTSNHPHLIHFSYRRYLENKIRKMFGFDGSPIVMQFTSKNDG